MTPAHDSNVTYPYALLSRLPTVHGPARGARIEECPLAQLLESVPELLLRVHHDRALPGDGLLERLSRHGASARFYVTNVG